MKTKSETIEFLSNQVGLFTAQQVIEFINDLQPEQSSVNIDELLSLIETHMNHMPVEDYETLQNAEFDISLDHYHRGSDASLSVELNCSIEDLFNFDEFTSDLIEGIKDRLKDNEKTSTETDNDEKPSNETDND
jgi:hypothetical protein